MQPTDLDRFTSVSNPHVHPDGRRVVFDTSRMDLEEDKYVKAVWQWDGSSARRLTSGDADTSPRWSPDGSTLAFLRKGPEKTDRPQLAVMPADGGEAEVITDFDLGVMSFHWSPDGTRLLALAATWREDWAEIDDEERARRPRMITGARYRFDSLGWVHDRRVHHYVVDAAGDDEPQRVGDGDASEGGGAWHPDGNSIAFLTVIDDPLEMRRGVEVVVAAADGSSRSVVAETTGYMQLAYAPDGTLHGVGNPEPNYPTIASLWAIDGEPVDLTGHTDRSIFSFLMPPAMAEPGWEDDGFTIGRVDGGRVSLQRFADGGVSSVIDGDRYVTGYTTADDGTIYFCATSATNPGELYSMDPDGSEHQLTSFNEEFQTDVALIQPEAFTVESEAGVVVDGWMYVPPGDGPFPVLLNIHGGPASQYGYNFFDEFQVYAGAGYAVVACNPRGSAGRGEEWIKAVKGKSWGVVDVVDVMAVLDHALADDRLDSGRVGVMGGSYGGFLTAWLIAESDRFASAVVERALLAWESFSGTSDIARDFSENYLGLVPPHDHEGLREKSPLARAAEIHTPTLILHSEADFRCPIEQAEQLFMALLRNGTEVAFLRFPGESHELSRSGQPKHRRERFDHILEWHAKHLA